LNKLFKYILFTILLVVILSTVYNLYPEVKFPENKTISKILVKKSLRKMEVYSDEQLLKTYSISLSKVSIGDKKIEGDMKTPEGSYIINDKNPNSSYHLNLGISYPDSSDVQEAKLYGKPPGGDIKIHGIRNGLGLVGKLQRLRDWTNGCIGLTNKEIEEIYNNTPIGTIIEIRP